MEQLIKNKKNCTGNNLMRLIKSYGTNMTEVHKATGVPITTIQRICKDPDANPTISSLIPIASYFSVTIAQLVGEDSLPTPNMGIAKTVNQLPLITWKDAIHWPKVKSLSSKENITTDIKVGTNAFALKIIDNNNDYFHKGSFLIVDQELQYKNGDYVVAYKDGSAAATLKQIVHNENDTYLRPTNSEFKTVLMTHEYRIIGIVVQVRMDLKEGQ